MHKPTRFAVSVNVEGIRNSGFWSVQQHEINQYESKFSKGMLILVSKMTDKHNIYKSMLIFFLKSYR